MRERRLVLLRHGKAELPDRYPLDSDRPLTPRGKADARVAGVWLVANDLVPARVLCSPAVRTVQTWQSVAAEQPGKPETLVQFDATLYLGGAEALLHTITLTPDEVGTLLVIGHNPTLSIVSGYLDPAGGDGRSLRTAGLAVHRVAGSWEDCKPRSAPLVLAHTARSEP